MGLSKDVDNLNFSDFDSCMGFGIYVKKKNMLLLWVLLFIVKILFY